MTIQKLTPPLENAFREWVLQDLNLRQFFLGNFESLGYSPRCLFWLHFKQEKIESALLKYMLNEKFSSFIIAKEEKADLSVWKALFLQEKSEEWNLSGKKEDVLEFLQILPSFPESTRYDQYFATANLSSVSLSLSPRHHVHKVSTLKECELLVEFYNKIPDFGNMKKDPQTLLERIQKNENIYYYILNEEKIVSAAQIGALSQKTGIIFGVATLQEERKKGYASSLIQGMILDQIHQRQLSLFFHNPEAGRIYNKLGFQNDGEWITLKNQKS